MDTDFKEFETKEERKKQAQKKNKRNSLVTSCDVIEIEVDGTTPDTEHDLVEVNGVATISGTLSVDINYSPANNDRIVFLTATSISGSSACVPFRQDSYQ